MTLLRRVSVWIYAALVCFAPEFACPTAVPVKTTAHYNVTSRGFAIGDVVTTQRRSEEGGVAVINFETKTVVKASFLWIGYLLDTMEKGTLQNGELVSYSRKGRENGDAVDVEGRLEHSSFRFDMREHGVVRSGTVPRNSYDYTTMECPEAHLELADKTQVTLRILDVERMVVVKRDYRLVKNANYAIGGRDYPCRVVDFNDQNKAARRWIAWDGSAVVMYRQDSKGGKTPYSVQATSVGKVL